MLRTNVRDVAVTYMVPRAWIGLACKEECCYRALWGKVLAGPIPTHGFRRDRFGMLRTNIA